MGVFAWVTLATNDSYSLGALVLAHSLKQAGTAHQLAVLVTPGVTNAMREKLASVFNVVQEVNILDSRDEANLRLLKRPELGITFTKLHCWRLTQYEKCVFLDADTLVLQNSDELFEREEFSAAPDVGWPDCFNSGVFVYRPSLETYEKLIKFALEKGSFDGGDQGLLNLYFSDWAHKDISKHLPFIYNMCSTACYSYLPAFKQFGANAKIIHFIGAQKPWLQYFNTETKKVQPSGDSSHLQEVLQRWWDIFCSLIHPHLSPAMQDQSQHGMSPSYFPPQYDPPPNPTASADDYENTWDPWDEYDQKLAQSTHYTSVSTHHNQPIESLNTNTSRVANQPSIHSQPQSHDYNIYSVQNTSYYQPPPPQVVYHHIPRVPTPPLTPQPQYHSESPQFYRHDHQPENNSQPLHQHETPQYHHPEPQYYHQEDYARHNQSHEQSYHNEEPESHSHPPERPRSPNRPDLIPILPKECEATTTVSNDMSLSSTIEDSSKPDDAGLAGAFSQLTLGVARTAEQDALENVLRKQAWEVGNIDYLGRDSFANIWSKITETLSSASSQPPASAPAPEPEVPSAPAQSQSETAPQAEATPVQPSPTPVEPPTEILSSTDVPKADSSESSLPVEAQKEIEQAKTADITPQTAEVAATESSLVAPVAASEPQVPAEKEPVAETLQAPAEKEPIVEPAACPLPPKESAPREVKAPEPQAASEPITCPPLPKESATQDVKAPEPQAASEPITCPLLPKESATQETKAPETPSATEPAACPLPSKESITQDTKASEVQAPSETLEPQIPSQPQAAAETQPVSEVQAAPAPQPVPSQTPAVETPPQSIAEKEAIPKPESAQTTPEIAAAPKEPVAASQPVAPPVVPAASAPIHSTTVPAAVIPKSPEPEKVAPKSTSAPAKPTSETPKAAPEPETPKTAAPVVAARSSPETKVTEATPPATPATPPIEKTKQALTAEASIPATPPPSEGGSTPTPPPRKTDKPKKAAAKSKK